MCRELKKVLYSDCLFRRMPEGYVLHHAEGFLLLGPVECCYSQVCSTEDLLRIF